MALFDRESLQPGVKRRELAGWAMYDFANSGYTTVVLTAVFNAYFVGVIAQKENWATLAWTVALSLSCLLVMLTAPAIGAYADRHRAKKTLMLISTIGCVATTAALATTGPGTVIWAMVGIIASNYFFSIGESLNSAFLPELATKQGMGRVSGWGWSFGYFGGMLSLGLCLAYVITAEKSGATASQFVPVTMLITAGIFAVAAIPTFLLLKERGINESEFESVAEQKPLSFSEVKQHTAFFRLLWCGVSYQAGISVVIALAAVYAEQVMGFKQTQTMMLVFVVNIASALGAFGFGYFQDRIGHKRGLAVTLVGWIVMVLLAGFGAEENTFWVAAFVAGLCMGSSQSVGRAMVGTLAPQDRLGEFFGLWALAVRLAAIIGPLTYGLVTLLTAGNHRLAILMTGLFFVVGLILLRRIDMPKTGVNNTSVIHTSAINH
jgi:MFS transporter, UMF1 family